MSPIDTEAVQHSEVSQSSSRNFGLSRSMSASDGNAWHRAEIDSESPNVSIGAIVVHCFFVAAVAGCCYAMLGGGQDQGGDTVAGVESEHMSLQLPEDGIFHFRQDLRLTI